VWVCVCGCVYIVFLMVMGWNPHGIQISTRIELKLKEIGNFIIYFKSVFNFILP
jgi:hypothetical protein